MDRGLFGPESVSWKVNREAVLLLGGGRALLMQLAHPRIAAGVDEHSDFRARPLQRLLRTLELSLAMVFGTKAEAGRAAAAINHRHHDVRGDGYSALDPDLLLWVHATLVDSALVTYDAFVAPLTENEKRSYYRESQVVGSLLGIPRRRFPADLPAFETYVRQMLTGAELRVDDRARALAERVLRPPLPRLPEPLQGPATAPMSVITAGLLPASLRELYGLPWGLARRTAFGVSLRVISRLVASAPRSVREVAPARRAARRLLCAGQHIDEEGTRGSTEDGGGGLGGHPARGGGRDRVQRERGAEPPPHHLAGADQHQGRQDQP